MNQKLKEKLVAFARPALCGLAVVATMAFSVPAQAATITVANKNDSGAGSLRQAITDSVAGGTINFQAGLSGTITLTSAELLVNKNLTITGPGAANLAISGNFARRVFNLTGTTVSISGLKIINGDTSASSNTSGGGIRAASNVNATISDCVFDGNTAAGAGGGICNLGTLTVSNCTFSNNSALNNIGGGIESEGALIVDGSTFISNAVANNGYGGGIGNYGGSLQVSNSTFASNQAVIGGGGIFNQNNVGTATVTNCTFNSNYHTGTDTYYSLGGSGIWTVGRLAVTGSIFSGNTGYTGGGIYNVRAGVLSVTNSTFTGNTATGVVGGAIHAGDDTYYSPSLTVDSCTITGNSGNGIYVYAGTALIKSSTITGNSVTGNGAGFYNVNASTNIYNCTIAANNATLKGGGIYRNSGTVNLRDSIVAKNTVNSGGTGPDVSGSVNSQDYNLIGDVTGATFTGTITHNITGQDPLLGTLANNGGPTQTMALLSGSPAIDNGFSGGLTSDQRGSARIYDNPAVANATGGDGSDIGAFEVLTALALPTLAISDVTVTEGNSGQKTSTFTITRSGDTSGPSSVHYATADGTAAAGIDYTAIPDTVLNFSAGQTSKQITVSVTGDTAVEPNETFFVNLTNPSGATIADAQGVGTINNDDGVSGLPNLFISDVQMYEGNTGSRAMYFTIALSAPAISSVTVNATTAGQPGFSNPATPSTDFSGVSTSVTFAPGETSKSVPVNIVGDATAEADELFAVKISTTSAAVTLTKSVGVGTIVNDDGAGATALTNVALSPNDATSAVGSEQKFMTTQRDSTGNANINDSRILVGSTTTPLLYAQYNAQTNLLYLRNDANNAFIGGFAPGSGNVISNSHGSLNCANTTVFRNGTELVIVWAFTPTGASVGTNDVSLYAHSLSGLTANFEKKGTWTITNLGPLVAPVTAAKSDEPSE